MLHLVALPKSIPTENIESSNYTEVTNTSMVEIKLSCTFNEDRF